jgi:hypothetical protein
MTLTPMKENWQMEHYKKELTSKDNEKGIYRYRYVEQRSPRWFF